MLGIAARTVQEYCNYNGIKGKRGPRPDTYSKERRQEIARLLGKKVFVSSGTFCKGYAKRSLETDVTEDRKEEYEFLRSKGMRIYEIRSIMNIPLDRKCACCKPQAVKFNYKLPTSLRITAAAETRNPEI